MLEWFLVLRPNGAIGARNAIGARDTSCARGATGAKGKLLDILVQRIVFVQSSNYKISFTYAMYFWKGGDLFGDSIIFFLVREV